MRKGTRVVLPNGQTAKVVETNDRVVDRERVTVELADGRQVIERLHRVTAEKDADK